MEVIFLNVPLVKWIPGRNYWTKPKWVRIRADNIENYQEYYLDQVQRPHTGGPITKIILRRAIDPREEEELVEGGAEKFKNALLITIATDVTKLDDTLGTHTIQ